MEPLIVFAAVCVLGAASLIAYAAGRSRARRELREWAESHKTRADQAEQAYETVVNQRDRIRDRYDEVLDKYRAAKLDTDQCMTELAMYRRLRDRLGLRTTADKEWAVPNLDRLHHPDFPNPAPLLRTGAVRWGELGVERPGELGPDERMAGNCYLSRVGSDRKKAEIMATVAPATDTRPNIRTLRYSDGREIEIDIFEPKTWPKEVKSINGLTRKEIEQLPSGSIVPIDFKALPVELETPGHG